MRSASLPHAHPKSLSYVDDKNSYFENGYRDKHVVVTTGNEESGFGAGYLHVIPKNNFASVRWVTNPQESAISADDELYGWHQKTVDVGRKKSKFLRIKGPAEFSSYDGPATGKRRRRTTKEDISEAAAALSAIRGAISEFDPVTKEKPESKAD